MPESAAPGGAKTASIDRIIEGLGGVGYIASRRIATAIFIARRVSWSSDGKSILAAVGEGDADVVLLDGVK